MNKYSIIPIRSKVSKPLESPNVAEQSPRFPNLKFPVSIKTLSPLKLDSPRLVQSLSDSSLGISQISKQYNKEREVLFKLSISSNSIKLPTIDFSPRGKSDFRLILDQIDTIVQKKGRRKSEELLDGESDIRIITKEDPFFYWTSVKGRKKPLTIKLKSLTEAITVYVSTTNINPGPECYDMVYNKSCFKINDFNIENSQVYLGLYTETECKYEVIGKFWKIKMIKIIKKANSKEQVLTQARSLEIIPEKSPKNKIIGKDFIKANVKRQTEAFKVKDLEEENYKWANKRKEVLERRKTFMEAKKMKTIDILNKQVRKLEFEKIIEKERERMESIERFQTKFITLIQFLKTAEIIREIVLSERGNKLRKIEFRAKVRRLQRFVKEKVLVKKGNTCLDIAYKGLSLYRSALKNVFIKQSTNHIIKILSERTSNSILAHKILNFRYKVLKIQRNYRRHHFIKLIQLKRLNYLWKTCLDKLKYNKKSKKSSSKFEGIPASSISRSISEYYSVCWDAFRQEIQKYCQNKLIDKSISRPAFKYMLTEGEMIEIIRNFIRKK